MVTPFQKNYTLDEMNIENMKPVANFLKGGRKSSTSTVPPGAARKERKRWHIPNSLEILLKKK